VEKTTLRECADIVRRMLTVPNTLANELPIYEWVRRWDVLRTWQTVDVVVAVVMMLVAILMEIQVLPAKKR